MDFLKFRVLTRNLGSGDFSGLEQLAGIAARTAADKIAARMSRNKIFVSYSHKDARLFDEFKTMMAPAIQNGVVDLWDDKKIPIGSKWEEEIEKALASARIAVLLVSQNFLASHFITQNELPPLLRAASDEGVTIFWIYLSSCLYEQTEIRTYQAAHNVSRPLDRLSKPERQAVLSEVCFNLIKTAQTMITTAATPQAKPSQTVPAEVPTADRHWECCLLLSEAIEEVITAAGGGGPTTTVHRRLDLARKWVDQGTQLLPGCRYQFSAELARDLESCRKTVSWLISESRLVLPEAGEDKNRGKNEHFERAQEEANHLQQRVKGQLKAFPEFIALQNSDRRWAVLGFRDRDDYQTYLFPTLERLVQSSDPMQRDLFERLMENPEFTPGKLAEEGYGKDLVMDSLNALLSKKWAEWTDPNWRGLQTPGRLTPVGKRLLKQMLASGSAT